ncbi:HTR-like protein [Haloarcula marismortui ATCC 43049]|uniref:histidine kinase n=1 Tax=Haloarcula marismortui (strain ATCC 43049 / DSM 3752 / JCM 8966 / VKM B-1809) TaxID=272569 RepID=Q5UXF3_HALMA|nr:PAS domain S-box protein [Haloarcula marismortui]AAV48050.1 HTR-like protein [Haloarcula marismortui ATCC 43049]QCP92720.1 PAS domain S-box protein [Haloarcula marismortui ATCC 43049]
MADAVRVLHVEDDPEFASMTAAFLSRADDRFDVVPATSANEGLTRLSEEPIDCVVSDFEMPGQDGIEFLESVRAIDENLPFILFTGKGSEEVASEAISAGVTDYLQKQQGTDQYTILANRIANAVEQYRSQRALDASRERLSLFIDKSPLGVIEWDESFEVVQVNEKGEEILRRGESALAGKGFETLVPDSALDAVEETITALQEGSGGYYTVLDIETGDGEEIVCEWHNRIIREDGETVAIFSQFQEITERRQRQQRIEALHDTTRELMHVESREAAAELVVETARDLLGLPLSAVFLADESADALRPTAVTDQAQAIIDDHPTFSEGDSLVWEVFDSGEQRVFNDVSTHPNRYNPDTDVCSELLIPLGDHGVLIAASTDAAAFEDASVSLMRTLAANTEEALSRLDRQQELRTLTERHELALEGAELGVWDWNVQTDQVTFDERWANMLGYTLNELDPTVDTWDKLIHPKDRERTYEALNAHLDGETEIYECDHRLKTATGDYRWIRDIGKVVERDENGDPVRAVGIHQDVTDHKKRKQELEDTSRKLQVILDTAPTYILMKDIDSRFLFINSAARELYGIDADKSVVGLSDYDILPDRIAEQTHADDQRALEQKETVEVETVIPVDGTERTHLTRKTPILDDDGEPYALCVVATDITDQKQRERELARLTDEYAAVFENTNDAIALVDIEEPADDPTFRYVRTNEAYERQTGFDTESLTGQTPVEAAGPDIGRRIADHYKQCVSAGEPITFEERDLHPTGVWETQVTPIAADGEITRLVAISRDISDRIEYREELERQNDRLEEFASIVSHDLRNPLSVLEGSLTLARDTGNDEQFDRCYRAIDRMKELIEDLLTLAREGDTVSETEPLNLEPTALSCWHAVETSDATLEVTAESTIYADESRVRQLLENLINNAVTHGGPAVTVEVGDLDDPGFYVADDGGGIPPEKHDTVFESGYTTTDGGTGFGLAIVKEIAAAHDWSVSVTESDAGGARFEFRGVRQES